MIRSPVSMYLFALSLSVFLASATSATNSIANFVIDDQFWSLLDIIDSAHPDMRIYGPHAHEQNESLSREQALHVHVTYDEKDIEQIDRAITSIFPNAQTTVITRENDLNLYLTIAPGIILPEMIFVTAVFESINNKNIIAQYALKPKSQSYLDLQEGWIKRFRSAILNDDETSIIIEDGKVSISLHPLVAMQNSQQQEDWYPWISNLVTSTCVGGAITAGSTFIYWFTKYILGSMGATGPCGNNMAVCRCSQKIQSY